MHKIATKVDKKTLMCVELKRKKLPYVQRVWKNTFGIERPNTLENVKINCSKALEEPHIEKLKFNGNRQRQVKLSS